MFSKVLICRLTNNPTRLFMPPDLTTLYFPGNTNTIIDHYRALTRNANQPEHLDAFDGPCVVITYLYNHDKDVD